MEPRAGGYLVSHSWPCCGRQEGRVFGEAVCKEIIWTSTTSQKKGSQLQTRSLSSHSQRRASLIPLYSSVGQKCFLLRAVCTIGPWKMRWDGRLGDPWELVQRSPFSTLLMGHHCRPAVSPITVHPKECGTCILIFGYHFPSFYPIPTHTHTLVSPVLLENILKHSLSFIYGEGV